MTKDVVVIPTFNRPEFLAVTLEHIAKNPDAKDYLYLFCLDFGFDRGLLSIIDSFALEGYSVKRRKTPSLRYSLGKQSHNVLTGYQLAESLTNEFVFLIEEDIFVANDFFKWHKEVHKAETDIFCSIATRNNNTRYETENNLNAYYLAHLDYQSLGVCFRKDKMKLFLKHATTSYFSNPISFIRSNFPNSSLDWRYAEQDGLIRRVQEQLSNKIAFPHVPRAFHAGFYGYNRGKRLTGTLSSKIEKIKSICFDKNAVNKVSDHRFSGDSIPENLDIEHWQAPLILKQATKQL